MTQIIADFFELWGWAYLGPFSQYMYKANLYFDTFMWLILLPLVVLLIYYIIWDSIQLSKTWIWFCIILTISVIISAIGFNTADAGLYDFMTSHNITDSKIRDEDYIYFSCICFGWTLLWSCLLSFIFKFFAVKARYIPF